MEIIIGLFVIVLAWVAGLGQGRKLTAKRVDNIMRDNRQARRDRADKRGRKK